jgi:hypothetical protein
MNKFNKNKLPYEFMNFFHLLVPSIVIIQGFLQNHPSPFLNFAITMESSIYDLLALRPGMILMSLLNL